MGLDPPTLVSLSPILRELAYKASPRIIMSLRPQDPIPDWITHLAILGHDYTLALAGAKEEVLFAVHRWANAHGRDESGITGKMAALMTKIYGPPLIDIGHTLSAEGIHPYAAYSQIASSQSPRYIQPTGEMNPEHLSPANQAIWQKAAGKHPEKTDLDDLLSLTCLLPENFEGRERFQYSVDRTGSASREVKQVRSSITKPAQPTLSDPLIELNNVVVSYGSKKVLGQGIQAGFNIPGLNLTICQGTRLALLGPNGSGKTTLLSLLTSDHPQSYSLPIKYFGRSRLPSRGQPGLSIWEIQVRIGHTSPEIHALFLRNFTIRRSLESAWAETFAAKPNITAEREELIQAFLRWWEPELDPRYQLPSPVESLASPVEGLLSNSYPPLKRSEYVANELEWASKPSNTFGSLPFQSQRLLLFLRAIIKRPDIVILDEGFSGFSPEVREKAMLFLRAGESLVLRRNQPAAYNHAEDNSDENVRETTPWETVVNRRAEVETICRNVGITINDLGLDKAQPDQEKRKKMTLLKSMTLSQLMATSASSRSLPAYTFTGLNSEQALIVVSHIREEIPDMVNEYVRLPGEEEVIEQGRTVEIGRCEGGSIRTVEGWNRVWGFKT